MRGLYAITPDVCSTEALVQMVRQALEGGAAFVQYRNKNAGAELRREQAQALLRITRPHRVPLIINDDVGLAAGLDADGVHLGRDDGDVAAARRMLPGKMLGVSCYADLDNARAALEEGADHVAFGSVFSSSTKPDAVRAPLDLFRRARSLSAPVVVIGGITLANAQIAIEAGADCLAVISDLFGAPDIAARAAAYRSLFGKDHA